MASIQVVGGIKAELVMIKSEPLNENVSNIVEISAEDIQNEIKEEVGKKIKLEDNTDNTVEIRIEDIQDEGNMEDLEDEADINMETVSQHKPDEGNMGALKNNINNNSLQINKKDKKGEGNTADLENYINNNMKKEKDVGKKIKLEDNTDNSIEIGIEDIQGEENMEDLEDESDINMETDSQHKPDEGNMKALKNNFNNNILEINNKDKNDEGNTADVENKINNNLKMDFQDKEEDKKKETERSPHVKEIISEKLLLNYDDKLTNIRRRHKREQKKMERSLESNNKTIYSALRDDDSCKVALNDYTVIENQKYRCNNCQFVTMNKKSMRVHIRNNHGNKDIFNSINKEYLEKALKFRVESGTNSRFISWYEYRLDGEDKYQCNHCQTVVETENAMFAHLLEDHRKVKMNQCPHCPYQSKFNLSSHLISAHTAEKDLQYFRCDKCDCKFKLKSGLRRHILSLHIEPEKTVECPHCLKMFKRSDRLTEHIRHFHEGVSKKKRHCVHCDYHCVSREAMRHHVETHHMNIEKLKTLQCESCPYKTKFKSRMQSHVTNRHKRALQCHICSYKTTQKTSMDLHLIGHKKKKDEDDLKHRCNECDYKTHRWYNLKVHKLNHLKPEEIEYFYCYHCDFKAKRKDNLKSHIFRHRKKEELPLQCSICDFTTKRRDQLIRHVDMHSKTAKKGKAPKTKVIAPS